MSKPLPLKCPECASWRRRPKANGTGWLCGRCGHEFTDDDRLLLSEGSGGFQPPPPPVVDNDDPSV